MYLTHFKHFTIPNSISLSICLISFRHSRSIYGLRLAHGNTEEELNIHFKYMDNTQQDIIQNCVFALYHRQKECEVIRTICNTFLPITPRPLLQRNDLRVCDDGNDVQLIEKETFHEATEETSTVTTTDTEQVDGVGAKEPEQQQKQQSAQERSDEAEDTSQ